MKEVRWNWVSLIFEIYVIYYLENIINIARIPDDKDIVEKYVGLICKIL